MCSFETTRFSQAHTLAQTNKMNWPDPTLSLRECGVQTFDKRIPQNTIKDKPCQRCLQTAYLLLNIWTKGNVDYKSKRRKQILTSWQVITYGITTWESTICSERKPRQLSENVDHGESGFVATASPQKNKKIPLAKEYSTGFRNSSFQALYRSSSAVGTTLAPMAEALLTVRTCPQPSTRLAAAFWVPRRSISCASAKAESKQGSKICDSLNSVSCILVSRRRFSFSIFV